MDDRNRRDLVDYLLREATLLRERHLDLARLAQRLPDGLQRMATESACQAMATLHSDIHSACIHLEHGCREAEPALDRMEAQSMTVDVLLEMIEDSR